LENSVLSLLNSLWSDLCEIWELVHIDDGTGKLDFHCGPQKYWNVLF